MQDNLRVVRYLISGESNELTIGHIPAQLVYMHLHFLFSATYSFKCPLYHHWYPFCLKIPSKDMIMCLLSTSYLSPSRLLFAIIKKQKHFWEV